MTGESLNGGAAGGDVVRVSDPRCRYEQEPADRNVVARVLGHLVEPDDMERRRLIDKDDLFRFRFIRSARLSPNGTRVAYVVSQTDAVKEEETSCAAQ